MKAEIKNNLFYFILFSVFAWSGEIYAKTKIVLVGDSTVATYKNGDKQGWGARLSSYTTSEVQIVNRAAGGRSTKTFLSEGLWRKALAEKPKYILIQFGHNDQNKDKVSVSSYKNNLSKMIDEAKNNKVIPILVTPTHRLNFKGSKKLSTELTPYADAMFDLAKTKKVDVIDLHLRSEQKYVSLGEKESLKLFVKGDRTHTNSKGANVLAQLVANEAKRINGLGDLFK